jgi:hypothetical protein
MGVEPTEDIFMPPNGFEVREAHRDSSAPVIGISIAYGKKPIKHTDWSVILA